MNEKKPGQKDKFLSYFDLWDAFQKPGCPVCTLVENHSFRYLDGLLHERVNDVGMRVVLRKSLGFCNWHGWKATEIQHSALGLAIIYEDILRRIEERLKKAPDSFPGSPRVPFFLNLFRPGKDTVRYSYLGPINRCPACQDAQLFEKFYLQILLDFISEADFERQFNHSAGICFAHLVEAVERFPQHKNLALLIQKQNEKFEALRNEVAEFVRKEDFKYSEEPRGPEVDSWRRALEMVAGKREIFPNQMDREGVRDERALDLPASAILKEHPKDAGTQEELPEVVDKLKFENEKLRRIYEELREEYTKESSRASSLHYIAWKTSEDNKVLRMNLAGANAQAQGFAEHFERLNKEIQRLKELLKKQPQYDNFHGEGGDFKR